MKSIGLALAAIPLLLLPCACKKEASDSGSRKSEADASTPRTKSFERPTGEDIGSAPGRHTANSPETMRMIENADKMYDELQKLVSSLRDVRSQESLGAHLNAPEMADQAKTKITELETKIREAEPAWQKSLATLRARSGKFPDDETLSAYVAFANQRDTMTKLEMEAADITDPDQATALDERINEQNEKLRETRAKWQAVAKAKE